jgi:HdeA/HdeB family protein
MLRFAGESQWEFIDASASQCLSTHVHCIFRIVGTGPTTLDATKVTCDQFVHSKVGALRVTAAWSSDFYHGQRNSRTIDLQEFEDNLSKLERFCYQDKEF